MKRWLWICSIGVLGLCGCGKFFVAQNSTGTTGTTTTNSTAGDVLYVANTIGTDINAYVVSSTGTLTAVTNSPYALGDIPTSMAITPGNTFLYIGTATGIVGYSIGTSGVLSVLNSGTALASDVTASPSMQMDTTGNFLLASGTNASGDPEIGVYLLNTSTGSLAEVTGSPFSVNNGNPNATGAGVEELYIAPNDAYLYLALGSGGTEVLTFDNSTGIPTDSGSYQGLATNGTAQVAVTANSGSTLLFISETGLGVRVFKIGTSGLPSSEVTGSPFSAGTGPTGLTLNAAGTDLYVADKESGQDNIVGFSVASTGTVGALTKLSTSPYAAGTLPESLTLDQSGSFLAVANIGGSPDLGVYSISGSTAALTSTATETFGSTVAGAFLVLSTHPSS